MSSLSVIENKISAIQKYLKILGGYKKYEQGEIEKDINLRGAVERYLYLAVQAAIDLAEAVIAYKKYRKPQTMAESFSILEEEKIIGGELAQKLARMVGFRNVMAHDYEKINYAIVYDVVQNGLKDIKEFIKIIIKRIA